MATDLICIIIISLLYSIMVDLIYLTRVTLRRSRRSKKTYNKFILFYSFFMKRKQRNPNFLKATFSCLALTHTSMDRAKARPALAPIHSSNYLYHIYYIHQCFFSLFFSANRLDIYLQVLFFCKWLV